MVTPGSDPSVRGLEKVATDRGRVRRLPVGDLLAMLAVGVVMFGVLVALVVRWDAGARWDHRLVESVDESTAAASALGDLLSSVDPVTVLLGVGVVLAAAAVRRRIAAGIAAAVLLAGANATTRYVKYHVLPLVVGGTSLPSGHSTFGMSVALAAVLVAPPAAQRVVLPVAGFVATALGVGTVVTGMHRPADVLGAELVCLSWAAVALAGVLLTQRRRKRGGPRRPTGVPSCAGVAAVGLVLLALGGRPAPGDGNVTLFVVALVPVGVVVALILWWVSTVVDRYVA